MHTIALIALLSFAGCTPHRVTPQLTPPPPDLRLAREGRITADPGPFGGSPIALFSVTPETLAALLIRMAHRHNLIVDELANGREPEGQWLVRLQHDTVAIFPAPPTLPRGASFVYLGPHTLCLPEALLAPLRADVARYLRHY